MTLNRETLRELEALGADQATVDLVMAALEGEDALESVLSGRAFDVEGMAQSNGDGEVPSVYLHDVTVEGFRGIGPRVTLELPPGPGLTVVVGRNGSGKSSLAEGLEVLLTGDTLRWSNRRGPWKDGWRNLHHLSETSITARFQVEGKRRLTRVKQTWPEGADLAGASATAQHHGEKRSDLAGIGWEGPLDLYRPLLSYNELGMIGANPSALFDTLVAVLGLGPLNAATKSLSAARLQREKLGKEVRKEARERLIPDLEALEDERAKAAVKELKKRKRDLDALAGLGSAPQPDQDALRRLASLEVPGEEQVLRAVEHLEAAHGEMSQLIGTDTERAQRLVRILRMALEHHERHGDDPCPVCGEGTLNSAWRDATEEQIGQLTRSARRYRAAEQEQRDAIQAVRSLVEILPLPSAEAVDTTGLVAAWAYWASLPDQPDEISDHVLAAYGFVASEAAAVSDSAAARFSEQEASWSAVSPSLMAWVANAREADRMLEPIGRIKKAEAALKRVMESLRTARWTPISRQALQIWADLRLQSSVDLRSVELAGSRTRRHVDLTVHVDGAEAQALAVASQGEISCLALSLFFPRATLPESPFRFLVIDDPVQSMDPARVDGLARTFDKIAKDRQLIVFTHDDRLPEVLRRLQIEHTCRQATRRSGSVVEIREKLDPVFQYFLDARAVIRDDELPEEIARQIVPGFCREGLEAVCVEVTRRRGLGRGESHSQVADSLENARRLLQKASLALFDDPGRDGRAVSEYIERRWERRFNDAFWAANKGAHHGYVGSLRGLINDCQGLAERIRQL